MSEVPLSRRHHQRSRLVSQGPINANLPEYVINLHFTSFLNHHEIPLDPLFVQIKLLQNGTLKDFGYREGGCLDLVVEVNNNNNNNNLNAL